MNFSMAPPKKRAADDSSSPNRSISPGGKKNALTGDDGEPWPGRHRELPISIEQRCLAHETSGQDVNITLRLFKLACLAYKPGAIKYRD